MAPPSTAVTQSKLRTQTTVFTVLLSLVFIVALAVSLQLVFEYRGNLPKSSVGKVLDDVFSSVVGAGKASEARFEHEEKHVKEKLRGLKADMEGAE